MKLLRMTALIPLFGLLSTALIGCGNSDVVAVSGTATYKNKPLANHIIHFTPATGRPSIGTTDAQGNFTLSYNNDVKGAVRGKHVVSVAPMNAIEQQVPGVATPPVDPDVKAMRDKYSPANSKYTVDITGSVSDLKINLE